MLIPLKSQGIITAPRQLPDFARHYGRLGIVNPALELRSELFQGKKAEDNPRRANTLNGMLQILCRIEISQLCHLSERTIRV